MLHAKITSPKARIIWHRACRFVHHSGRLFLRVLVWSRRSRVAQSAARPRHSHCHRRMHPARSSDCCLPQGSSSSQEAPPSPHPSSSLITHQSHHRTLVLCVARARRTFTNHHSPRTNTTTTNIASVVAARRHARMRRYMTRRALSPARSKAAGRPASA